MSPPETTVFGRYRITHYRQHPENLAIVFASAGMDGLGEPIEEFKTSLSGLGVSMIFVIDQEPSWYVPLAPGRARHHKASTHQTL